MTDFRVPTGHFTAEIEVKRSRFIAHLTHCKNSDACKTFINKMKADFPDARHHCHAFMGGSPSDSNQYGYGDDGEPSGTAGKPMFAHLQHSDIGEICIVVVRYFGGTKLGTGGLARAYSDAVKAVLDIAEYKTYIASTVIKLSLDFSQEAEVRSEIQRNKGLINKVDYSDQVTIEATIPKDTQLTLPYSVNWLSKSAI